MSRSDKGTVKALMGTYYVKFTFTWSLNINECRQCVLHNHPIMLKTHTLLVRTNSRMQGRNVLGDLRSILTLS